jgi:hypothetical protein
MKGNKYAWNSIEIHIMAVTRPVSVPTQTHQSHMAEAVFHPTVQALVCVFYELHLGQRGCPPCQGPPLIHTGVWSSNRWWTPARCLRFFSNFDPLINLIIEMISRIFFQFWLFWSRQTSWCSFELGHTKHLGVTHGHIGIGYHVNSDGPALSFGHKESHHVDWCDQYESCHLSWRDSFWVKISMLFLLFNIFL